MDLRHHRYRLFPSRSSNLNLEPSILEPSILKPWVILMNSNMTLSALTSLTGLDVFDYLDQEVSIPVIDGLQAQGDLIVIPFSLLANIVAPLPWTRSVRVPLSGVELLRSAAGGNPHSLVADEGECTWSTPVKDARGLALGMLDTRVTAYLIHPEHGATGIAPGRYVIGRQQERGVGRARGAVMLCRRLTRRPRVGGGVSTTCTGRAPVSVCWTVCRVEGKGARSAKAPAQTRMPSP